MKKYDVFISHAYEDKEEIAKKLAYKLKGYGLSVWYDEFCMVPGCNIRQLIDKGLRESEYGIVILSKVFIDKYWTNYELDGLLTFDSVHNDNRIIPIWHNISKDDLINYSASLVMKYAINTSNLSLDEIVSKLLKVIHPKLNIEVNRRLLVEKLNQTPVEELDPRIIIDGPIIREKLPRDLMTRLTIVYLILGKFLNIEYDRWIDGFLRDFDPNREIYFWENVTLLFTQVVGQNNFSDEEVNHYFGVCFSVFQNGDDANLSEDEIMIVNRASGIIRGMMDYVDEDYDNFSMDTVKNQ